MAVFHAWYTKRHTKKAADRFLFRSQIEWLRLGIRLLNVTRRRVRLRRRRWDYWWYDKSKRALIDNKWRIASVSENR